MRIEITHLNVLIVTTKKIQVPVIDEDVEDGYVATADVPLINPYLLVTCKIQVEGLILELNSIYTDEHGNSYRAVTNCDAHLVTRDIKYEFKIPTIIVMSVRSCPESSSR